MTDDLMRAMSRLAERGEPAGVEALLERIELQLAGRPDPVARPERRGARAAWRRPIVVAGALALVAALVATLLTVGVFGGSGAGRTRIATPSLALHRLVVARRAVLAAPGQGPALLTETAGSLWATGGVADRGTGTLLQLDPASGAVRNRFTVPGDAVGITSGFGSLWVAVTDAANPAGAGHVVRIDPRTGKRLATIDLGAPSGIAVGADAVWVTDARDGRLARIDPGSNRVEGSLAMSGATALGVAGGSVWVTDPGGSRVVVVDAAAMAVQTTFAVLGHPDSIVVSGHTVWIGTGDQGTVTEYDGTHPAAVSTVIVGGRVSAGAPSATGAVWLAVVQRGVPVLGVARPGRSPFAGALQLKSLGATAMVATREGLWILDPASSTLSLLEAR